MFAMTSLCPLPFGEKIWKEEGEKEKNCLSERMQEERKKHCSRKGKIYRRLKGGEVALKGQ
jgi:hypothetical protein